MTIKENSLDIMRSKLEKYQSLDFLNEGLIEHLEKKIIVHKKLFIEYRQEIDKLQADNKTLQNKIEGLKSSDDVRKLRICRLKNDKLQADNKRLYQEHKGCRDALEEQVSDLMIDKDRLIKQVSSNRDSNSNTHTHTIQAEIDALKDKHGD